jgi:hypothetical protein
MANKLARRDTVWSTQGTVVELYPNAIIETVNPTVFDSGFDGQLWVNTAADTCFVCGGVNEAVPGEWIWISTPAGDGNFAAATISPGDLTVTDGDVIVELGDIIIATGGITTPTLVAGASTLTSTLDVTSNVTIGGSLTVTGATILNGDFDISSIQALSIVTTSNTAGAISLIANGGTSETIVIRASQGTGNASLNFSSTAGGVTLTGGKAAATAINLVASNAAGGLTVTGGTAGFLVTMANGEIRLASGTGAINIGADAVSHAITAGNSTGTTAISLNTGTGNSLNLGTNAIAHTITIGNITGATAVNVNSGSGACAWTTTDGAFSLVTGTGTIALSGDSAITTLGIATGAAAKTVTIGNSSSTTSVSINTGTGSSLNLGANAIAHVVTIGNVIGVTAVNINTGSAGSTYTTTDGIFTLATGTGAITISGDAAATAINIGTGAGVIKTIAIGGNGANVITIGNAQTAGSVAIGTLMTSGTISIGGTGLHVGTISIAPGTGAQTVNIGTGGTGIKTINVATGAVANVLTIGSTTGAASTTIQAGTAGIALSAAGMVSMVPATDSQTSPTAASTVNANVVVATFTGFTTAAAGTQVFTITNSKIAVTSGVLVDIHNEGSNDAQMTIMRRKCAAGSIEITTKNNGAAALNGDVVITLWVVS